MAFYVYILSNKNRTVYYIGVTNNLPRRLMEHKTKTHYGFTSKYNCFELLYYETFDSIKSAIQREKNIKKWKRIWKEDLIQSKNPSFNDLSNEFQ